MSWSRLLLMFNYGQRDKYLFLSSIVQKRSPCYQNFLQTALHQQTSSLKRSESSSISMEFVELKKLSLEKYPDLKKL